jgi:hypothetical protein
MDEGDLADNPLIATTRVSKSQSYDSCPTDSWCPYRSAIHINFDMKYPIDHRGVTSKNVQMIMFLSELFDSNKNAIYGS